MTRIETPIYDRQGTYWRDAACSEPFYDQEAAARLWYEKYGRDSQEQTKAVSDRVLGSFVLLIVVLLFIAGVVWLGEYLDESGYIFHDEMTIVYSPNWQFGEYKTCTTINGAGSRNNILCDGGVPSGRIEDGKVFKVRFWGRTYDEEKPAVGGAPDVAPTVFYWDCRKNEGGDPAFTCKQAKK